MSTQPGREVEPDGVRVAVVSGFSEGAVSNSRGQHVYINESTDPRQILHRHVRAKAERIAFERRVELGLPIDDVPELPPWARE